MPNSNWQKIDLQKELRYVKGKAPSHSFKNNEQATLPYLSPEYLRGNAPAASFCLELTSVKVKDDDLILLWDGSNAGEVFRAKAGALASTMAQVVFDKSKIDPAFFYYFLKNQEDKIRGQVRGSGVPHVDKQIIGELSSPIPTDPAEQRAIADILSTVDEAIAQSEALVRKYQSIKQGLMSDLLTRGVDENGELRDEKDIVETKYGYIPNKWECRPLGEIATVGNGVTLGRKVSGSDTVELPYIRVANVKDGYLDLSEIKYVRVYKAEVDRFILQPGDMLMTEGGDFDKLGRGTVWDGQIENCLHQNHIFRVRVNQKILLPRFLSFITGSPYGRRFFVLHSKQTTNLASVNSTQLKSLPVPLPKIDEQRRILQIAERIDKTIDNEIQNLNKLALFKQGLMQDLLSGQVRVKVQADENSFS